MWAALTNQIRVRRRTAEIVAAAVAAQTMSVARQPVHAAYLEASVSGGTANTGEVTFTGLVAGVTTTEVLTFDGSRRYAQTSRAFTTVACTTSGLANEATAPTVAVRAVGADGSPQDAEYDLVSGWPAAIGDAPQSWTSDRGGGATQDEVARAVIAFGETWAPREGDGIVDDHGRTWRITGAPKVAGTVAARHWVCRIVRHEG